nr:MAG TPA: hypothetical protein [Caudoviricetes sp.]
MNDDLTTNSLHIKTVNIDLVYVVNILSLI